MRCSPIMFSRKSDTWRVTFLLDLLKATVSICSQLCAIQTLSHSCSATSFCLSRILLSSCIFSGCWVSCTATAYSSSWLLCTTSLWHYCNNCCCTITEFNCLQSSVMLCRFWDICCPIVSLPRSLLCWTILHRCETRGCAVSQFICFQRSIIIRVFLTFCWFTVSTLIYSIFCAILSRSQGFLV